MFQEYCHCVTHFTDPLVKSSQKTHFIAFKFDFTDPLVKGRKNTFEPVHKISNNIAF